MPVRLAIAAALAAMCTACAAQQPLAHAGTAPIVIGESHTISSAVMGGDRAINISLPSRYAESGERYPVLYLLDGGVEQDFQHVVGTARLNELWGRSREVIVVGIETSDRRAELAGPTTDPDLLEQYPTAGQSETFRRFLADEVIPFVEANFRTSGESGLTGESLAGLFVLETWFRQPRLFTRYVAISPSLWWDDEKLTALAPQFLGKRDIRPPLAVVTENEGEEMAAIARRFASLLPASACHAPQEHYGHSTIYHAMTPAALQFLFPPAEAPAAEFGFEVPCSPRSS